MSARDILHRRTITLPPRPAAPKQASATPSSAGPWARWIGNRVVVQRHNVTYIGLLQSANARWLILTGATVIGAQQTVSVPEVWVDMNPIAHIHAEVAPDAIAQRGQV